MKTCTLGKWTIFRSRTHHKTGQFRGAACRGRERVLRRKLQQQYIYDSAHDTRPTLISIIRDSISPSVATIFSSCNSGLLKTGDEQENEVQLKSSAFS